MSIDYSISLHNIPKTHW